MAHGLAQIDWHAPWLAPWRGLGQPVAAAAASGLALPEALNQAIGSQVCSSQATGCPVDGNPTLANRLLEAAAPSCPVRFVPQSALPVGRAYERYIFESGTCPTREGLHDFFNGLCWHLLPRSKQRMNALQAAGIAQHGIHGRRGAVRDALTVLDENGALLHAPAPLWAALLARDWSALFISQRALWQEARLFILGHALLEKLVQPRKALVAHVWRAPATMDSVAAMDAWLAHELTPEQLARKPFAPLPVLGLPGWCAANADPQFYADPQVFRPLPSQSLSQPVRHRTA